MLSNLQYFYVLPYIHFYWPMNQLYELFSILSMTYFLMQLIIKPLIFQLVAYVHDRPSANCVTMNGSNIKSVEIITWYKYSTEYMQAIQKHKQLFKLSSLLIYYG